MRSIFSQINNLGKEKKPAFILFPGWGVGGDEKVEHKITIIVGRAQKGRGKVLFPIKTIRLTENWFVYSSLVNGVKKVKSHPFFTFLFIWPSRLSLSLSLFLYLLLSLLLLVPSIRGKERM